MKPAVQKADNNWSVPSAFRENYRGVRRAGQKLRSRTKDLHFPFKPPPCHTLTTYISWMKVHLHRIVQYNKKKTVVRSTPSRRSADRRAIESRVSLARGIRIYTQLGSTPSAWLSSYSRRVPLHNAYSRSSPVYSRTF